MFTKPSSRRLARLITGAAAALVPLVVALLMAPMTPQSRSDATLPLVAKPSSNLKLTLAPAATMDHRPQMNEAEPLDREVRQAGGDESWWQAVSAQLERQGYTATSTPQGLQAPNRAHNLRTTFGERGIEVVPRTEKGVSPPWRFTWKTSGFGRPGRMQEVSSSPPSSTGARITYQRDGWSEWYENTAKGLEQGFTVDQRPAGEGRLHIAGTFPAAFQPEIRDDGAVDFLDAHGACAIRYGELHVWDASGKELPAELMLAGSTLAIEIDDQDAAYPLIVDPLMTSPAWTAEGNSAFASFGNSVATAGDVNGDGFSDVIVGALYLHEALVYHGSASGLATTPAWTAVSDQANAGFGQSVATAGDVNGDGYSDVIVGAYSYGNGENGEGRAFVYHGSPTGLATSPAWTAESNQAGAAFGYSVASAGDVNADGYDDVIVGASLYANGDPNEGRAFVYHGSSTGLATAPAWMAENNQQGSNFGSSVAGAGDLNGDGFADVVVGAPRATNPEGWEGRAYAYHGSASGLATSPAWTAESNQIGAEMGNAVAGAGDVNGDGYSDVIVGAHQYDNGQNNEGRAYVFHGSASGLGASPAWTNEVNQGVFGYAVATAGDVNGDGYSDVIVGAWNYNNGQPAEGGAFVFEGSASGLATSAAWTSEGNQIAAQLGFSVATAGDVNGDGFSDVIVGAPFYDNGEEDEGRAFVYHGAGSGLATTAAWTAESNLAGIEFGWSLATAGDVNGDGYSDVIVGAPGSPLYNDVGRAFVYHGSAAGLALTPAWTAEGDSVGVAFGLSVGTAGDVNGDGFSDVIVGATGWQVPNHGWAFVYHGSPAGLASAPDWTGVSPQAGDGFGYSVATAGDVNGDGYSDVIIGAPYYSNGNDFEGRALVYHGSAAGLGDVIPEWTAESNWFAAQFGFSVGTAGDVNGDGFSDIIVGAPQHDDPFFVCGRAFVYHGSEAGVSATPAWTDHGLAEEVFFGWTVGTAGDVNGGGYSDVIVSANSQFGGVSVYHGSPAGLSSDWDWYTPDSGNVGTAGDVNADGFSDVIIGDIPPVVYHGSALGLNAAPNWSIQGLSVSAVATAGDVNGDAFSDIVLGDRFHSNGQVNEGRALVYYGGKGEGLERRARQVRTDDSAPIWLLGNSDSDSAFRLKVLGRTAAGRGDVRLQFEVKPAGVPFDGTGLVTGPVTDTGQPGPSGSTVPLSELASGLTPETLYHWRLRVISNSPFFPWTPWMWLPYNSATEADVRTGEATTAVDEAPQPRAGLWLANATPNPFNPRTTLAFLVPARIPVRLAIHDVQGRLVRVLVDEVMPAGQHAVEWDGRDGQGQELATGVYLSRLEAGGEVRSQKLALVK